MKKRSVLFLIVLIIVSLPAFSYHDIGPPDDPDPPPPEDDDEEETPIEDDIAVDDAYL